MVLLSSHSSMVYSENKVLSSGSVNSELNTRRYVAGGRGSDPSNPASTGVGGAGRGRGFAGHGRGGGRGNENKRQHMLLGVCRGKETEDPF
jgi:hypothetical protein